MYSAGVLCRVGGTYNAALGTLEVPARVCTSTFPSLFGQRTPKLFFPSSPSLISPFLPCLLQFYFLTLLLSLLPGVFRLFSLAWFNQLSFTIHSFLFWGCVASRQALRSPGGISNLLWLYSRVLLTGSPAAWKISTKEHGTEPIPTDAQGVRQKAGAQRDSLIIIPIISSVLSESVPSTPGSSLMSTLPFVNPLPSGAIAHYQPLNIFPLQSMPTAFDPLTSP
jgi:hypothetical protein